MSEEQQRPKTHKELRTVLDGIRTGKSVGDNGKVYKRPELEVNREVWVTVLKHLRSRGEFFRAPQPHYFDRVDPCLIRLSPGDGGLAELLRTMGLLPRESHTVLLRDALLDLGKIAPPREVHRLSYFDGQAAYLRASETRMVKVTADTTTEVPLGTDGVILMADDLGVDWPTLVELEPHIAALEPIIGTACTQVVPDSPMAKLTSRWSEDAILSHDQQWQMFFTRIVFTVAASRYSLWPLMLLTGDGGSGKSTALELFLAMLKGETPYLASLPGAERDLQASVTNSSLLMYDNVDGAGLDRAEKGPLNDLLCQVATGALIDIRILFLDNQLARYKVKNHALLTCRVNPFTRQDVKRRLLEMQMAAPLRSGGADRDELIGAVLADRPRMLAGLLIRTRNIIRAHRKHGADKFSFVTDMKEYERFTYICGAYEGTLNTTRELWAAHMSQYERSITDSNPLVFGLRLWLGVKGNPGRQISPSALFSELQTVYRETDQQFSYKSPSQIGTHVSKNLPSLRAIGFDTVPTRNNKDYIFRPSADELAGCQKLYAELEAIAAKRRGTALRLDLASLTGAKQAKQSTFGDWPDDLELERQTSGMITDPELLN